MAAEEAEPPKTALYVLGAFVLFAWGMSCHYKLKAHRIRQRRIARHFEVRDLSKPKGR